VKSEGLKKRVDVSATSDESVDREVAIKRIFEQMEQADARIRAYHAEIDQLRSETRSILTQLRNQLAGEA
jgi:hypothetical protein